MKAEFKSNPMVVSLLIVIVVLPATVVFGQSSAPIKTYPPIGKLVSVGGHRLHINCRGKARRGDPTVVLESGAGDFSFDWSLVQPEVAKFSRVCSYDRAGYAWSETGPLPRTMQQIAFELHVGLRKVGVKTPIVLVGHSLGGLIVRIYARQYPREVVGMVLVDSSHEDNQIMLNGKVLLLRETSRGRPIPAVQITKSKTAPSNQGSPSTTFSKLDAPFDKLPASIQQIRIWAMTQPAYNQARSSEFDYLAEEVTLMHNESQSQYPLGDIPLIVITRGKNASENHKKLQADLVRLSRNARQITAPNSDHHIQLDDPQIVIGAIRQVINEARKGKQPKGNI